MVVLLGMVGIQEVLIPYQIFLQLIITQVVAVVVVLLHTFIQKVAIVYYLHIQVMVVLVVTKEII